MLHGCVDCRFDVMCDKFVFNEINVLVDNSDRALVVVLFSAVRSVIELDCH